MIIDIKTNDDTQTYRLFREGLKLKLSDIATPGLFDTEIDDITFAHDYLEGKFIREIKECVFLAKTKEIRDQAEPQKKAIDDSATADIETAIAELEISINKS